MAEPVAFARTDAQRSTDGAHVIYPMSLLFRTGDYADKAFAMSADELAAAVAAFTPVGGNIEHTDFLKGRACEVRRVWADGDTLKGEVAVPIGLDALLTDDERKLSCEFDRATKRLSGIALCMKPRVSDAALMSELAGNDAEAMAAAVLEFAGRRHSASDQRMVQTVHDHAVSLGAECPTQARMSAKEQGMTQQQQQREPTRFEKFMAWLGGEGADDARFAEPDPPRAAPPPAPDPEKAALMARVAAMEAERTAERAAAFADGEIAAGRALPAERAALVAMFTEAAEDDRANPRTVTFAAGDAAATGTRVEALVARQRARPAHRLTEERLPDARVLPAARPDSGAPATMSAERRARLTELAGFTAEKAN